MYQIVLLLYKIIQEMPRKKRPLALENLTEVWLAAASHSVFSNIPQVNFTNSSYERIPSPKKTKFIPTNDVSINPKVFENTSISEKAVIIEIIEQLKRYNAFWYCDYRDKGGAKERAILSLRKKGVLFKTELNSLHLVNPMMIRKGMTENVISATYELLNTEPQLTKKHFKHLVLPKKTQINQYLAILSSKS